MKTLVAEFFYGEVLSRFTNAMRKVVNRPHAVVHAVPVQADASFKAFESKQVDSEFARIRSNF